MILIADRTGHWHNCNALIDCGSQSNLISESLCRKLNLYCHKIDLPLLGVSKIITKINNRTQTAIRSRVSDYKTTLSFLVLPVITEKLPLLKFEKSQLDIPKEINLADERLNEPKQIDVLLGAEIFYDLLGTGQIKLGNSLPILQETSLGWVISGNLVLSNFCRQKTICHLTTNSVTNKMLHDSFTKFWEFEDFESCKFLTKEENFCEQYFEKTTTRDKDNSFIVRYPFKEDSNLWLGDSKVSALKRLNSLEKRFNKDENLKKQYFDFMRQYEGLGQMTLQGSLKNENYEHSDSLSNDIYYLPHSAVFRDSITTKCRVVFDASSKTTSGYSLNDCLW